MSTHISSISYSLPIKTGAAALKYTEPEVTVTNALKKSIKMEGSYKASKMLSEPSGTRRSIVTESIVKAVFNLP